MNDIKNELTNEHDIYISIGLKNPMKPTECRDLIDSLIVENFTLSSWGTHTKDEWIDVVNECQEKVDSLITTIESQQITIETLNSDKSNLHRLYLKHMEESTKRKLEIESQKEEIEKNEDRFKELLRSRISEDNAKIWKLEAEVKSLKAITELKNAEIELLKDTCEALYQLTQRGNLTYGDLKEADKVYGNYIEKRGK